jgi:hypothetical protein
MPSYQIARRHNAWPEYLRLMLRSFCSAREQERLMSLLALRALFTATARVPLALWREEPASAVE